MAQTSLLSCRSAQTILGTPGIRSGLRPQARKFNVTCINGGSTIIRRTGPPPKPLEVRRGLIRQHKRTAVGLGDKGLPEQRRTTRIASLAGYMVTISTLYCAPFFVLMVVAPHMKKLKDITQTPWFIAPIAVIYTMLLVQSWEPDTLALMMPGDLQEGLASGKPQFFPEIGGISKLFSRATTAASLWVHLICINMFAARHMYLEGLSKEIPTRHSILISSVVGPLGLLCHIVTKAILSILRPRKEDEASPAPAI